MSNKLTYNGKSYSWDAAGESEDALMSASVYVGDSLPAVQLSVDTMTAEITDHDAEPRLLSSRGLPLVDAGGNLLVAPRTGIRIDQTAEYGQPVEYRYNDALFARFYLEALRRTGKHSYRLSCVSAVGLLLTDYHYGGIYTGQPASEVIADVIGGTVSYTLDAGLGEVPLYGLLRKRTRRDNLRDILFAVGGQIRKDIHGDLCIVPMKEGTPYSIGVDEFYTGGSVTGGKPATAINVTEHAFVALPSDDIVTLFDGAATGEELVTPKGKTVTGVLVDFKEPMHDLAIQNAEILESGVNYAVISNSPAALLTGKQYTHTTRIVSRGRTAGGTPNVVNSSACELVNLLNSELVADRLMAYYGSSKTVEAEIVVSGHKPGDAVTFTDPFGDAASGYIADMELTMSAILKARTTLIAGYIPGGSGNYYSNMMVITKSGTITIPAGVREKVLVVAIGGGDGGGLGNPGEDAPDNGFSVQASTGGAGGLPGVPGEGGKIYVGTVHVKAGDRFSVNIGEGGKGATQTREATKGGATTFGGDLISSANGHASQDGYITLITGDVYGLPGVEGIAGGRGADPNNPGENVEFNGVTYVPGAQPETLEDGSIAAEGGFGGGPAAGANGEAGGIGDLYDQPSGNIFATGGKGGDGATPVKAENGSVPGQGGQAGHGGGGGGSGGRAKGSTSSEQMGGGEGKGGLGGEGGDGANGILFIFY